jgi:hypothetical protein
MSRIIFFIFVFTAFHVNAQNPVAKKAEELVKLQLEGYNKRDIDLFLSAFSDTVKIYEHPAKFRYQGIDKMREGYSLMFANSPDLHCEIINRIILGNTVIDQERVVRIKGQKPIEVIAIYKIHGDKITEVYFVRPEGL